MSSAFWICSRLDAAASHCSRLKLLALGSVLLDSKLLYLKLEKYGRLAVGFIILPSCIMLIVICNICFPAI
jgi:hypothetical protein